MFSKRIRVLAQSTRVLAFGAVVTLLLTVYMFFPSTYSKLPSALFESRVRSPCSPEAWSNGNWTPSKPSTNLTALSREEDVLQFAGFEGCASDREFYWHFAADRPEQWNRFPDAMSWKWTPSDECNARPLEPTAMVQDMVENGGWLLIGDSVTENHFFSISCILFPHVRATPNYTENPYFDRAWPQHLYLEPSSPLIQYLNPPPGFNISTTPLVTFRRVDLLLSKSELVELYQKTPDSSPEFELLSNETFWSMSPVEYMDIFQNQGNYGTLVISTGGHWTVSLFAGLKEIDRVLDFFRVAMKKWADDVTAMLARAPQTAGERRSRQVVIRAYLPGHEDCHDHREPWVTYQPFKWNWYNWGQIKDFNRIFQEVTSSPSYPDIHYLGIDQPALLRPDGHAAGDCLHIMTGAGILEGWTQYIWHYVTREVRSRIR